ncbi:hypothetical protein HC031_18565 [Planosporangium thailandense]|uniref:Lipoprotein n=1 Tax=Planosporangium thailandense TaxID=765197 RepID=A0ABX0Y2N6_9ACTN|nr:hypothetical protein [Planosporangium thailandense]NJC71708.1 hypothetical protein [Planosporangium thailandense]
MSRLSIPSLLAVVAVAALVGCDGTAKGAALPAEAAGSGNVECADGAAALPAPTAFPREVPLPPKAVVTGYEERSGGRQIVTAVVPGTFQGTLGFMQKAYPSAGLELKQGEVEAHDAESNFAGQGLVGRWTLKEISGCHGDTLVTVLAAKG